MSESDDAIERLSKKLYAGTNDTRLKRSQLYQRGETAPTEWNEKPTPEPVMKKKFPIKPLEALFGGSIAFFVIAVVVSVFLFFGGNNTVSTKNVDVKVSGPTEIGAGSTLSIQVIITNRNAVPMELTDLVVEFPDGTRSDADISRDLPRLRESLGTVKPGESVNRTVRAVLFGLSGSEMPVKVSAEYRVPSSNAVFVSETTYVVLLNESPAAISIEALKEAISGQEISFTVDVSSNAPDLLADMLLLATYPPGFKFSSSAPAPILGEAAWDLGDIEPGGKRTVKITGTFSGEDGESKVLHFSVGNRKSNTEDEIAAPLALSDISLTVKKPFISIDIILKGERAATYAVSRGEVVEGMVRWSNNLPTRVQNVAITLLMNGQILDKRSVRSQYGFYDSNSSSILWDKSVRPIYADIAPGASGSETFSFSAYPPIQGNYRNADIQLSATVKANRVTEGSVPESISSSASVTAYVLTDLKLNAIVAVSSGPVPPKVGVESRYLVTWQVSNTANAVANTLVSGVLPSYVNYVGAPSGDGVTFDENSRTVSWDAGDLAAGQSKAVSFAVSMTPSTSQISQAPVLMSDIKAGALDRYVRYDVDASAPDLKTSNASASLNGGNVVP